MNRHSSAMARWAGALLAPVALLALLGLFAFLYSRLGMVSQFVTNGLQNPSMIHFAVKAVLTEILPLYVGTGLLIFIFGMLPVRFSWLGPGGWDRWSFRHAFWGVLGLLGFIHAILWSQTPMAMGVLPGLSLLPMGIALLLLYGLSAWACWCALSWGQGLTRKALLVGGWALLAWGAVALPQWLATRDLEAPPVSHPARVLMISIDGLRQDVANTEGLQSLPGFHLDQAYAALPATRLEWSILWGGDPRQFSVGHVMPSVEEFEGHFPFEIIEAGKAKGLKARFYIDDGGTIGLKDRSGAFDRVLEPAAGWENFLNSNISVQVPLYAVWLDALRIFPCTTPWSPLDLGLRRALEDGQGADWVMFHSCLSHQPIFLRHSELAQIPHWWLIPAGRMMPLPAEISQSQVRAWRPEYSPFLAYQLRTRSLISAWGPVWKQLAADQNYGPALRIFMSDHGERFYHITPEIQLGGVHAFNLDPWELRIPLVLDGPGIPSGHDSTHAVGLLAIRDVVAKRFLDSVPVDLQSLLARDYAPMRMSTLNLLADVGGEEQYRQMDVKDIIEGGLVGPDGMWATRYKKPAQEREADLTVAEARGDQLTVWHPLKGGGARRFIYRGYQQQSMADVDESDFQKARQRIFTAFLVHWDGKPGYEPPPPAKGE